MSKDKVTQRCASLGIRGEDIHTELFHGVASRLAAEHDTLVSLCNDRDVQSALCAYDCFISRFSSPAAESLLTNLRTFSKSGLNAEEPTGDPVFPPDVGNSPSQIEICVVESGLSAHSRLSTASCRCVQRELLELSSFLAQRIFDSGLEESDPSLVAATTSAQGANPSSLQQQKLAVDTALSRFSAYRLQELLEIHENPLFVKRLVAGVSALQNHVEGTTATLHGLCRRLHLARDELVAATAEQEATKADATRVANVLGTLLSEMYDGRPVVWVGAVGELLSSLA